MNRNLKTISAAILAAVMCASFTGCSKKEDTGVYVDKNGNVSVNESKFEDHVNSVFGGDDANSTASSKPEPKPLDPFDGLEVTFEGIAPRVKAAIKGQNSNVSYSLDKNSDLKNGDKVIVTAEISSYKKDEFVLTADSREFDVLDRPYYIMTLSELTDEDVKKLGQKITDLVPEEILSHAGGGAGSTVNSLDFIGNVNLTKNNGNYRLYFVYKANVTFAKAGKTADYIFAAYYGHIYKDKDGTLIFEDGKPFYNSLGDMSMTMNGNYVGGAYESVDSLYAQLSGFGAERESNVKEQD